MSDAGEGVVERGAPGAAGERVSGGVGSVTVGTEPRVGVHRLAVALAVLSFGIAAVGHLIESEAALWLGVLAFLAGIAAAFLGAATVGIVAVAIDAGRGVARLSTSDGGAVDLPLSTIERADAVSRVVARGRATSTEWAMTLHKRDGGRLDTLIARNEADARRTAGVLNEALAALRARPVEGITLVPEVMETLGERTRLRIETAEASPGSYRSEPAGHAIAVGWSARSPWMQTALVLGVLGGFGLVARTLAAAPGQETVIVAFWFVVVLAAIVLVFFAMSLGVRVRVHVDDASLSVERRRFGRPFASRRWPIDEVTAIDLSIASSTTTLVVRTTSDAPPPELDPTTNPIAFAAAVARHAGQVNQLPLGTLTLADGIHLDLALSADIARRKGVDPALV